jgi:prophage regulatory protein
MQRRGGGRSDRRDAGHSALYREIRLGLWPPFVKLGRSSTLPEGECNAMLAARVAGASQEELRALVQRLVAQRKTRYQAVAS